MRPKGLQIDNPTGTEVPLDLSKQIFGGGAPIAPSGANQFFPLTGGNAGEPVGSLYAMTFPIAGVCSKLTVKSDVAPGIGKAITATLYKNGVATFLSCQIAGNTATFATDGVNSVTITATDEIELMINNDIGSAAAQLTWGILNLIP